ncbi:unnamed protein product [Kluyveromyces dobzhanskii CBS 2104]|uniref:protein-histidine N-methyltransferase n=1 Tax=Kluyveromyces dobzhanskii CBS 2104 TaxID=1427455 RepID=A0A0A8LB83_9SACH|nr:unnamed protein product [Kluyveromyces dobzhanskii CBS 2104]
MSFAFGFSNEDLSDDELDIVSSNENGPVTNSITKENPLDSDTLLQDTVNQPKFIHLDDLLKSLANVRLSFEEVQTSVTKTVIYRRELFDVKHQLMSEVDSTTGNIELEILMGETNEDLRRNVYEGGLKSWECSIDLVDSLIENPIQLPQCQNIIELGCGTSLPSEFLFMEYLRSDSNAGINFTLCDYNESVLRLVSVPNMIIAWAKTVLTEKQWSELQTTEVPNIPINSDELLLTCKLLEAFKSHLLSRNISFSFISGSWGRQFMNVLSDHKLTSSTNTLILTAETIYQPDTLPVITETLIELILNYKKFSVPVKCLLAAKDIYFGVGGSIVEFEEYITKRISADTLPLSLSKFKVNAGLKRSIVLIE